MLMAAGIPAIACAGLGALGYVSVAPRSNFWGRVVHRGDAAGQPCYALTFDDGPCDRATPAILDTLGELNARATFFVIGLNARRFPNVVRRIFDEGHIVGNHSFNHSHFGVMRAGWYWDRQIRDTDALLQEIIGVKPALFRPPMGARQFHITRAARRHGHTLVTWSRRALDGFATTPERIVARLSDRTLPGDILLMHDGVEPNLRRDPTASIAAVRPLILALRQRGLEPAPLDELIKVSAYAGALQVQQSA
ncbi:MAG: putative hydrolase [Phycisphaerales bacterium]|nr:putative hydrolase [Phycisphaerales bacterium]